MVPGRGRTAPALEERRTRCCPLSPGRSRGVGVEQRDVEPHSGGIEASAPSCRHHPNALDDETDQLTALAEVRFNPQAPRIGMQDDPLLALAINLGMEPVDFPLYLVLIERYRRWPMAPAT